MKFSLSETESLVFSHLQKSYYQILLKQKTLWYHPGEKIYEIKTESFKSQYRLKRDVMGKQVLRNTSRNLILLL